MKKLSISLEVKYLDINFKKDSSLLLHAINSNSIGGFLKKTRLSSGFKNTCKKKICETRKLESIREWHLVERKIRVEN
jgi:hypothetical protein